MNPPISDAAAEALREPGRLPVFVSADGRRRRVLRLAGRVVAGLTALWLVALLAGALGLGRLPGISLPQSVGGEDAQAPAAAREATPPGSSRTRGHERTTTSGSRPAASRSTGHRSSPSASTPGGGRSGVVVVRPGGSGGPSPAHTRTPAGTPAATKAPAAGTSPGHSGTAPAGHGVASHGSGPPARTEPPGASRAHPSPSAMEHSHRWSTDGG